MNQADKTPIDDLKKNALVHYESLSSQLCEWNSFVVDAINAYNPNSFQWTDEIAEEYAKWCMNIETRGWGNMNSFKKLYVPKTGKSVDEIIREINPEYANIDPVTKLYTQQQVDAMREDAFYMSRAYLFNPAGDRRFRFANYQSYKDYIDQFEIIKTKNKTT